jgi:hypothetical protein
MLDNLEGVSPVPPLCASSVGVIRQGKPPHTGVFCQKWRDNLEGVSPVPPLAVGQAVGRLLE